MNVGPNLVPLVFEIALWGVFIGGIYYVVRALRRRGLKEGSASELHDLRERVRRLEEGAESARTEVERVREALRFMERLIAERPRAPGG